MTVSEAGPEVVISIRHDKFRAIHHGGHCIESIKALLRFTIHIDGLKGHLREALDTIAGFLAQHPDETVLMQAKRDIESLFGTPENETPETRKAVEDCFSSYACSYTATTEPTLDECRGKMALLSTDYATKGIKVSPGRDGAPNIN